MSFFLASFVIGSVIVSSGNAAGIAANRSAAAGITPLSCANILTAALPPDVPASKLIADVLNLCPYVTLISPSTISTVADFLYRSLLES